MSDQRLLDMAAKAAGMDVEWLDEDTPVHTASGERWDPRHDDGDALRLAVKLAIEVVPDANGGRAYKGTQCFKEESDDRCAATRRAIVRAAAVIGESMP